METRGSVGSNFVYLLIIWLNSCSDFFNKMVNGFEKEYRLNSDNFIISYEELYYNNGFEKIVNYLNIDSVKNIDFPYGEKYRLDKIISNKLIWNH